jgi:multidrug efflux system membrane fusion protein
MQQTVGQTGAPPPADAPPQRPLYRRGPAWLRWLLVALVVLVLAVVLWRLVAGRKPPTPAPPPTPVGVSRVTRGDMAVELRGIGTVTPTQTITVQSQISGYLFKVAFKEGQIVRKGQLLDLIDPRPYENALAQAEGTLVHDTGLLEQAKVNLQRFQLLGRQDSIAQQTVADQAFLVQQLEGTVMTDRATIRQDKLNIAYCHISAPVTGRVGLRLVDAGNYIQAGAATALVVITQLQPITVIFVLPESDVPAVTEQLATGAPLQVSAWDRESARELARGTLLTIDNTIDTTTGAVKLRASFPNERLALFPNQFVNARLTLQTLRGATIVSSRAVQHGAPGTFVYLLRPNGTVHVQVIRTGVAQGDEMQVLSGLTPGETVVTDGVDRLREGARVRVVPEARIGAAPTNNGPGAPPGEQPQNARRRGGGPPAAPGPQVAAPTGRGGGQRSAATG